MNHEPIPAGIRIITRLPKQTKKDDSGSHAPLVLRRSFDIRASCGRENDTDGDSCPISVRLCGTQSTPLLRCAAVGAAVIAAGTAAALLLRARRDLALRRRYAQHYEKRLAKKAARIERRVKKQRDNAQDRM